MYILLMKKEDGFIAIGPFYSVAEAYDYKIEKSLKDVTLVYLREPD